MCDFQRGFLEDLSGLEYVSLRDLPDCSDVSERLLNARLLCRLVRERIKRKGSSFTLTVCLRAFRAWADGEKAALPSVKDEDERSSEDIKGTVSLTILKLKWSFLMKSRSCACNRRRKASEARRNASARQTDIIIPFLPFSYN